VSFTAITLCIASQRVFIVVVCFVIESVRKLLDIPSYIVGNPLPSGRMFFAGFFNCARGKI